MEKYQGNLTIDEIIVGEDVYNIATKFRSKITNKTENSVEVYNQRSSEKGVNSSNWYALEWFNRYFRYYKEGEARIDFKRKNLKSIRMINEQVHEQIEVIW